MNSTNLQRLLKDSWALVEEQQDRVAGWFYARLFLTDPRLRDLFPVHMDVQRSRLLGAIVTAVQSLETPDTFDAYLRGLGRDHRKFQVEAAHYTLVGDALVEAIRVHAGQRWSYQYEQAWRDAYAVIARAMLAGAAADTNPAWWHAEVVSHERRAPGIAVLRAVPLDSPIPFQPGQYASLETYLRPRLWRTYSIANAPRSDHSLELHVRAARDELYDLPALQELAGECPWLTVVPALSEESWDGECGTVAELMRRRGPWADHDFYVSGSEQMVTGTLRLLAHMQVPSTRIRYDSFGDG